MTWEVYEEYQKRRAALKRPLTEEAIAMPTKLPKHPRDPARLAKLIVDIATGEVEDRAPTPEDDKNAQTPR